MWPIAVELVMSSHDLELRSEAFYCTECGENQGIRDGVATNTDKA